MGAYDVRKLTQTLMVFYIFNVGCVICATNQNDLKILNDFRNGLEKPDLLEWPLKGNDPCGPPAWPHVGCSNGRVTEINVQGLGLKGPLPQNLNQLDKLEYIGFQKNQFSGKLPSFSGLSNLQHIFLDFNEFDTIPFDFFRGLSNLLVVALDSNPLNRSFGWSIPNDLAESAKLVHFSCSSCNIVERVPDFFGKFSSLNLLRLSSNKLSGEIPSSFHNSMMQVLRLNDQEGVGMSGSIDVLATMVWLTRVWLQGNQFTGSIPDSIVSISSLKELDLSRNQLVGLIPLGLGELNLEVLDLSHNMFMGPIPKFKAAKVSYEMNSFCQPNPGVQCAPEVHALLGFLHRVNYPTRLASGWKGNGPCVGPWWGISCTWRNQVSVINLSNLGLNGTLSPSLVYLSELVEVHLDGNHLHGTVPVNLTLLKSLRLLDLTGNDFDQPLPQFRDDVEVRTGRNSTLIHTDPPLPSENREPSDNPGPSVDVDEQPHSEKSRVVVIVALLIFTLLGVLLGVYFLKKRKNKKKARDAVTIDSKDSSDSGDMVKIEIVEAENGSVLEAQNSSGTEGRTTNVSASAQVADTGTLVFSLELLRKVTNTFSQENELGRGGFGAVYKGKLEDGTEVAVKRMEAGIISDKALNEFETEIAVLSNVRHRHLVSLLGYSVEGNERLLVYEYMPHGTLSRHLFHWKSLSLEPLPWTRRLNIALDVARGLEYLHGLTHQSFIHRDLKSANILLDDDFRAKVSDFGLVKLSLDTERSVPTRLAGTFGYLAPEYAVTGKITKKVDVFSFGVVLMELLTGQPAIDERRPEEKRYLVEWFWQIKSNKEALIASIDPALDAKEDTQESIYATAELAGHCTARDPNNRPEIGYAVNVLAQLVEAWRPNEETDQYSGIDLQLPQLVKGWQEEDTSCADREMKVSRATKQTGSFDSFYSSDDQ